MPPALQHWLSDHIQNARRDVQRCERMLRKSSDGMRPLCELALREAEVRLGYALNWATKST